MPPKRSAASPALPGSPGSSSTLHDKFKDASAKRQRTAGFEGAVNHIGKALQDYEDYIDTFTLEKATLSTRVRDLEQSLENEKKNLENEKEISAAWRDEATRRGKELEEEKAKNVEGKAAMQKLEDIKKLSEGIANIIDTQGFSQQIPIKTEQASPSTGGTKATTDSSDEKAAEEYSRLMKHYDDLRRTQGTLTFKQDVECIKAQKNELARLKSLQKAISQQHRVT